MNEDAKGDSEKPDVLDYDDFYELLGVSKDASTDTIMDASRKLLAEYHPDSSSNEWARDVFKSVNRAQDILTNKEQRAVYNYLGHDKYVRKREQGNISLSDEFKEQLQEIEKMSGDEERRKRSEVFGDDDNDQSGYSEITYSFSSLLGTDSIEDLTTDIAYRAWVSRTYKYAWGFRIFSILLTIGVVSWYGPFNGVWDALGVLQTSPEPVQTFVFVVLASMIIGLNSIWFAHSRIPKKPLSHQQSHDTDSDDQDTVVDDDDFDTYSDRKSSPFSGGAHPTTNKSNRGLNIGEGIDDDSSPRPDVISQHHDKTNASEEDDEPDNRSLTVGIYSLLVSFFLLGVGGITGDVVPITYMEVLLGWVDGPSLWIGSGDDIIVQVFNVVYVILIGISLVGGGVLSINGISKRVWNARYIDNERISLLVWDGLLTLIASTGVAAIVYGDVVLGDASLKGRSLLADVVVFGAGTPTVLDIGIIAVLLVIPITYAVTVNVWVSQKLVDNDWISPKP